MATRIRRGSVVEWIDAHSDWHRGIVLKLLPMNSFARAYGRQALVAFYGDAGTVYEKEVGIGDMRVLGHTRRVPKVADVIDPPHPEEVAHHEKIRDIRRTGQGVYYDPSAPHNLVYERPLPGHERRVVAAVHSRRSKRRSR